MGEGRGKRHSHLFALRIWPEARENVQTEWRGKIQHMTSGKTRHFRDWSTLVAFLLEMLPELGNDGDSTKGE
jgi:hypothetical protein